MKLLMTALWGRHFFALTICLLYEVSRLIRRSYIRSGLRFDFCAAN